MFNFVFAGAGHSIASYLLNRPGASKIVWNISIPYSSGAMTEYIQDWDGGSRYNWSDPAVSRSRAEDMISRASDDIGFHEDDNWTAIAVTAALQTDRGRKGRDHFWVARRDAEGLYANFLYGTLSKDMERQSQEMLIHSVVLGEMAKSCRIEFDLDISEDLMTLEEK